VLVSQKDSERPFALLQYGSESEQFSFISERNPKLLAGIPKYDRVLCLCASRSNSRKKSQKMEMVLLLITKNFLVGMTKPRVLF